MDKILVLGKGGRLATALEKTLFNLKPIIWGFNDLNLLDFPLVEKKILDLKPKCIVNCAAVTDVDGCETDSNLKLTAYRLNGQVPGFLARLCKKLHAVLIHFSTDYVFDGEKPEGYVENDKPNPLNIYGRTKLLGEELIKEVYERHYIVRTSWLWGEGNNFVSWFLKELEAKKEINLVADQFGKPTYVYDLARHIYLLFESQPDYGIYHFINEVSVSWYEIGNFIYDYLPKNNKNFKKEVKLNKIKLADLARPAARPRKSILINTKFKKMRPWQEAMAEYLHKSFS